VTTIATLGCGNPGDHCGSYPVADTLRYLVMFIITVTDLGLISMFIGRLKYGHSNQMDQRLFALITIFILGATNVFFFTEVARLNTKFTWRIFITVVTSLVGLMIAIMMMRGDFVRSPKNEDVEDMTTEQLRAFIKREEPRNRVVRRRAGRR
jgi:hypothetical protein